MQSVKVKGISIMYDPSESITADLISEAVSRALPIIYQAWGLSIPPDCCIYILTTWWGFFFQSAPFIWKIALFLLFPFWAFRARRMWPYSAAWTQRYGRRVAIGVKPPSLLEQGDRSIGKLIFVEEKDPRIKILHLTCHELTHACSAHLRLPAWLNEGLAAVTVDRYLNKPTIQTNTLELLRSYKPQGSPLTYAKLSSSDPQAIAYQVALGYWLVQYLEQLRPGFLKQLFTSPPVSRKLEHEIATELGLAPDSFWKQIPAALVTYFEHT